ncbi:MAG: hypothetical protein LBS73_07120 [Campylobacteraceae bacterium]|jgi:uncharacterized protein (DUF927 family)|nr:hypothetical protein [Campylobacteraceae bacterium]
MKKSVLLILAATIVVFISSGCSDNRTPEEKNLAKVLDFAENPPKDVKKYVDEKIERKYLEKHLDEAENLQKLCTKYAEFNRLVVKNFSQNCLRANNVIREAKQQGRSFRFSNVSSDK